MDWELLATVLRWPLLAAGFGLFLIDIFQRTIIASRRPPVLTDPPADDQISPWLGLGSAVCYAAGVFLFIPAVGWVSLAGLWVGAVVIVRRMQKRKQMPASSPPAACTSSHF